LLPVFNVLKLFTVRFEAKEWKMKGLWRKLRDKSGQSLVEYALILALVAIVVIAALTALGAKAANTMNDVSGALPAT